MEHQFIAAQVGDVIKKVESHYASDVEDGECFVVLDVFNGDDTAVVLGRDGKLKTLVYPEEYEVVSKAQDLVDEMYAKMKKNSDEFNARITEQKANGTYVDVFEGLGIKLDE